MTDQPITDADLDRWLEIEAAATPNYWGYSDDAKLRAYPDTKGDPPIIDDDARFARIEDAALAALARSSFRALILEIKEHREKR